jgi:hypothetical protein
MFLAPTFTKLAFAHQNYVQLTGTEYHPNWTKMYGVPVEIS